MVFLWFLPTPPVFEAGLRRATCREAPIDWRQLNDLCSRVGIPADGIQNGEGLNHIMVIDYYHLVITNLTDIIIMFMTDDYDYYNNIVMVIDYYPMVNKLVDPGNDQFLMVSLVFQPRWLPGLC